MKTCHACGCIIDYRKVDQDFYIIGPRGGRKRACYACYFSSAISKIKQAIWGVFAVFCGFTLWFYIFVPEHVKFILLIDSLVGICLISSVLKISNCKKQFGIYNELNKSAKYQNHIGIDKIDKVHEMSGDEFENFIGNLFIKLGY